MHWRAAVVVGLLSGGAAQADDGRYLLHAAGCIACHTAEGGPQLAGGRPFDTPFGVFYSPNITPDVATGIGRWRRDQFIAALKQGRAPDGSAYFPVFPYPSYRQMSDDDAGRIFDHLMTLAPRQQPNRVHVLPWWLARWMMKAWQWWLLEAPAAAPADPVLRRGQYLVDALGHCGECHTPRGWQGALDRSRYLAGTRQGPEGETIPNITPQREDGIGKWSHDDLVYFLESGELPDGDYTGSLMTEVVENVTSQLDDADRRAMIAYLKSIPPLADP